VKILILKPSSLGDILHALPVLRLLKLHWPSAEIHWWVESGLAPLIEDDADLAGIFRFERRRWSRLSGTPSLLRSVLALRRKRFDLVIDLQGLARSAVFAWLANGTFTIGVDDPRESAAGFYDVAVPRPGPNVHAVDWYLEVLRCLKVPTDGPFTWLPPRSAVAAAVEKKWRLSAAPLVLLNPGARWWNKRWPTVAFARTLDLIAGARPDARFAVLGGKDDIPLAEEILRKAPIGTLNLAGQTSLHELIEVIRSASLMITNDTGPMHMAAAAGTPMIALFGPTNPARTGPYGSDATVMNVSLACAPCLSQRCHWTVKMECLRAIQPETVAHAALERLAMKSPERLLSAPAAPQPIRQRQKDPSGH
jgi:heptosyltransferase I